MLTGQTPFPFENVMAVLTAHMSKPPPPLSARRHGLPAELDAVLDRALAKSPGDRYPSCGDFTAAFQRATGMGQCEAPVAAGASRRITGGEAATLAPGGPGGVRAEPAATRSLELPTSMEPPGQVEVVRGRWRRGRLVIAAAAAVAVAVTVVAFLALAPPRRAPGAHSSGTGDTAAGRTLSAPRWHTYADPSRFTIGLPPGWAVASTTPGEVRFTETHAGFVLVVAWNTHPQADALADWKQQAAEKAVTDPSYRQISIRRVRYHGYNAADWEFTNIYQRVRIHVIDRGFIVQPGQLAYAVELYGPASQWSAVYASIWKPLVTSFQPAP
jgi:hypothetical protein